MAGLAGSMHTTRTEDLTRGGFAGCLAASLVLLVLACVLPPAAFADDVDRVRELRSTSSIMPLSRIMKMVELRHPGTLLEVELEEEHGLVIYEIEILGDDKVVRELKVNARNGHILSMDKAD